MQHYRFNRAVFGVYALAAVLAGLFLSAGIRSLTGQLARFPDNYLFNLIGAIVLSWACTGTPQNRSLYVESGCQGIHVQRTASGDSRPQGGSQPGRPFYPAVQP